MDILFFLGSGVSYKSGMPDTKAITNNILNGQWNLHTDRNFYKGLNNNPVFQKFDITPHLQKLLIYIKKYSDDYYKNRYRSKPNLESSYEDIFFIVKQIHDDLTGEVDNPAIRLFIDHLRKEFRLGNNPDFGHFGKPFPIEEIFWYAEDFINCAVWNLLPSNLKPKGYNLLLDFVNSKDVGKINIGTTNHDLLIETFFEGNRIDITDGFSEPDGDFCYFAPGLYKTSKNKVNLYKLHGSLNWYRLRDIDKISKITSNFYAKIINNPQRCQNSKGEMLGPPLNSYPIFLTGTNNKLEQYNFGIIRQMHLIFDNLLQEQNLIIMSGYGWNDRGINSRLFEWVYSSMNRKIILLHENPEEIKSSKSAMWNSYDGLVKDKRIITIKKWFSDSKIEVINPYLI